MSKKLFVTGTGTDVGKTYITALMVKKLHGAGLRAAYYKAAMSGNVRRPDGTLIPGDALCVQQVSGIGQSLESMCPYVYEHAYSPHLASRLEGNPVRMDVVKAGFAALESEYDYITVEGSGGILCPICFDEAKIQLEDVIRELDAACVIVADAGLGTINSVGLTVSYMRAKGIPVRGLIFNHYHPGDVMEEDNLEMCRYFTGLDILACVRDDDAELDISPAALAALYE
ncbi:MAG: dethiobiotin synthase [Dysosmobacter sp.]|nr:dethiobiotin synthase [Dysosmobacter sp.]